LLLLLFKLFCLSAGNGSLMKRKYPQVRLYE
jgi:hypothetical protein